MHTEVECPDCGGVGTYEDRKGNERPCQSCKGKGKLDDSLIKKENNAKASQEN
jgi:DnaJ-class molecular chaperone